MLQGYKVWLEHQKYDPGTVAAQLHRAERVEKVYGDLDAAFAKDRLSAVLALLTYSRDDERRGRPNPSKIDFKGNAYSNLASYRDAVRRYVRFRDDPADLSGEGAALHHGGDGASAATPDLAEELGQRIGLERDMQAALRRSIAQLDPGLSIIDDGAERSVASGFIDITARDPEGHTVVIELKAGTAGPRAVAQILAYMGDLAVEDPTTPVRGILVAADFDSRARSAAHMVPALILRGYRVQFSFFDGARP